MKKKILFCIFDLNGGGAEKVLVNLLRALNPSKYEITLFAIFGVGPNLKSLPDYVRFKCVFRRQFRGFTTFMKLFSPKMLHRIFIKDFYDIEIAYLETSPTRIISGAPNGVKKVCWVHIGEESKNAFVSTYRSYHEFSDCYNKYDHIAFVSQKALELFVKNHPEITVPKSVIYNVNLNREILQKAIEPLPEALPEKINICTVGRLCRQKGYMRLLEIVNRLNTDGLTEIFNLYILGKGEEYEMLRVYVDEHRLSNVYLLGFQSNPYKYVSKMDLFVCSSYKEGYSTAVTESIILKVPVITTDVSGMDEILQDGKYGLIVPNDTDALYDGMLQMISHPERIQFYKDELKRQSNQQDRVKQYEEFLDTL